MHEILWSKKRSDEVITTRIHVARYFNNLGQGQLKNNRSRDAIDVRSQKNASRLTKICNWSGVYWNTPPL